MTKGFSIVGVEDVDRILNEVTPRHARNLHRSTVHAIAGEIAKRAKKNATPHKQSGTLKRAIKTKRRRGRPDKPQSDVVVNRDAFYWRYLEYGTQDAGEHPFFRPAAMDVQSNLQQIMVQQFGKKLEAALRRERRKKERAGR